MVTKIPNSISYNIFYIVLKLFVQIILFNINILTTARLLFKFTIKYLENFKEKYPQNNLK